MTDARQRRGRVLLGRLGIAIVALLVSIVGAELLVRLVADVQLPLYSADPEIGRRHHRSWQGRVWVEESAQRIDVRFNREGFRGPDLPLEKADDVVRVALIGDSMTLAIAVPEEDTLAAQLQRILAETRPDRHWEVMNMGASAASTGQELAVYQEVARSYSPDLVVCVFYAGNDVTDNSRELSSRPRIYWELDDAGELHKLPLSTSGASLNGWLNSTSHLYVWQKEASRRLRRGVRAATSHRPPRDRVFLVEQEPEWQRAWKLTGKLISRFAEEVRADGARFALLLVPSAPLVYPEAWEEVLDFAGERPVDRELPERRLRSFCEEAGAPYVSLTDDFRSHEASTASSPESWLFFERQGHMTVTGNHLAARVLHEALFESGPWSQVE